MKKEICTIDASNKAFGRLAVDISVILRGKDKPNFVPYKDIGSFVVVKNITKMKITGKKKKQKLYRHYSGYPGGLKSVPMEKVIEKKGIEEILRRAVFGMLPKNKLRAKMIKKLKFE